MRVDLLRYCQRALRGAVCVLLFSPSPGVAEPTGDMRPTTHSVIHLEQTSGWNLGARFQVDRRRLDVDGEELALDVRHAYFRLGARLLPFLHAWGEAGVAGADRQDADGSSGFAWGVGAGASLFDYVIRKSPVVGPQETISIEAEALYRVAESELPPRRIWVLDENAQGEDRYVERLADPEQDEDIDLTWKDARIAALFVYRLNRMGDRIWRPYEPTGYAVRGGPVYARTTGDYGTKSVRERNDFGAQFGFDIRLDSGWMFRTDLTWFNGNDRELSLGVHRFF